MGLFRSKSSDRARAQGVQAPSGANTLGDPEDPSPVVSAPGLLQPHQQQQPQHQGVYYQAATEPPSATTGSPLNPVQPGRTYNAAQIDQDKVLPVAAKMNLTPDQQRTLQHMQQLANVLDTAITIPVINRKIGLDGLIGLIPYVGDMAGATVGTYMISRALKFKLPKRLVFRMLINQTIDSCIGIIPFVGDIFDIGWKANQRNMKLVQDHLERPAQAKKADAGFLCCFFLLVVILPMILFGLIVMAIVLGVLAGLGKL